MCVLIYGVKDDPYFTDEDPGQSNYGMIPYEIPIKYLR